MGALACHICTRCFLVLKSRASEQYRDRKQSGGTSSTCDLLEQVAAVFQTDQTNGCQAPTWWRVARQPPSTASASTTVTSPNGNTVRKACSRCRSATMRSMLCQLTHGCTWPTWQKAPLLPLQFLLAPRLAPRGYDSSCCTEVTSLSGKPQGTMCL